MPRTPAINLAKGRGISFIDRFLNWALSIGRVIVILTEGVALGAFLFRFSLDRDIIDLHSKINQEEIIVKLLNKNETIFRNVQDRLALIKILDKQADSRVTMLGDLFTLIPAAVHVEGVKLDADTLQIETSAQNPDVLSTLIKQLKVHPKVASVSIGKIENRTTTASILITLSVKLRKVAL